MISLPIHRLILYKHGVGYFERRGAVSGETVRLTFKREEMNDVLKSLVAFDLGAGQVVNVAYEAPEDKESRLAGGSIHLSSDRSLLDLLRDLRGREVRLLLAGETIAGTLIGIDEDEKEPTIRSLVSVLSRSERDGRAQGEVRVVGLNRIERVELADERALSDLTFFLDASLSEETQRAVTLRLTPGEHDLVVGYIAASPTWRVSYRFVGESGGADESTGEGESRGLLQGWGIFENRLDEDLEEVTVSLVAGMPISFVYNLYEPKIPERPFVEEEGRVAAGPVMFDMAVEEAYAAAPAPGGGRGMVAAKAAPMMAAPAARSLRAELAEASPVQAGGTALGEMFKYDIKVPVTVRRGQAAMVPILGSDVTYRKEHLYNSEKLRGHPVVGLRFRNSTDLTLERGPVTVVEDGAYVGEAILDFTRENGEVTLAYAVDLAVKVAESQKQRRELNALSVKAAFLVFHEFDIIETTYRLTNRGSKEVVVTVEHPRRGNYDPFDMAAPDEVTADHRRWRVTVPAAGTVTHVVKQRALVSRREELARQNLSALRDYLRRNLLDQKTFAALEGLLTLYDRQQTAGARLKEIEGERQRIYTAQEQVRGNLSSLKESGEEGKLRARYVRQLQEQEDQLVALEREVKALRAEQEQLEKEIERAIAALA